MAISTNWNNDSSKNQYNEYKNCFETQEGIYKLIITTDLFSREKDIPNVNSINTNTSVMLSFLNRKKQTECGEIESFDDAQTDIMCVNYGKELFVYPFDSYNINQENISPLDKRLYKCTFPTCHDFNMHTSRSPSILLIVGFTGGQIQLIDPTRKEQCRLFNEERYIDKTAVTCIKWIPTASNQFLVSHASGYIYVYKEDLPCCALAPVYQLFKQGFKFCVHTCKTKSTRNPLYRWELESPEKETSNSLDKNVNSSSHSLSPTISSFLNSSKYCAVNKFAFSPTGQWLAVASQDGFLRIFDYHKMELQGCMRSYFGGIICLDWSSDEKFIVLGGQDDLVTVWSVEDQIVICRGQGHKSWVNTVKFDPFMCPQSTNSSSSSSSTTNRSNSGSQNNNKNNKDKKSRNCQDLYRSKTYRFGSVGQDTLLCLWELTEDVIRQALKFAMHQREKSKLIENDNPLFMNISNCTLSNNNNHTITLTSSGITEMNILSQSELPSSNSSSISSTNILPKIKLPKSSYLIKSHLSKSSNTSISSESSTPSSNSAGSFSQKLANSFGGIWIGGANSNSSNNTNLSVHSNNHHNNLDHKKHSISNKLSKQNHDIKLNGNVMIDSERRILGTVQCPRLEDIPMLEPIVSKHVSSDRLTDMVFREESLICTCQQGTMYAWARPGYSVVKTIVNQETDDCHQSHYNQSSPIITTTTSTTTTTSNQQPSNPSSTTTTTTSSSSSSTGYYNHNNNSSSTSHQKNNQHYSLSNYKINRTTTSISNNNSIRDLQGGTTL